MLRQLLLLPLLAPLLAVLVVGALNPRPAVRLRLLTLTSPPLPIGVWMAIAATGGALLSAGATSLALRRDGFPGPRRQVRMPMGAADLPWTEETPWSAPASAETSSPRPQSADQPSRAPGEPPPTVEVPFRVIRRAASAVTAEPGARGSGPAVDDWDDSGSDW